MSEGRSRDLCFMTVPISMQTARKVGRDGRTNRVKNWTGVLPIISIMGGSLNYHVASVLTCRAFNDSLATHLSETDPLKEIIYMTTARSRRQTAYPDSMIELLPGIVGEAAVISSPVS